MKQRVLEIINEMLIDRDKNPIKILDSKLSLREDLEFDSFDLAELTVKLDEEFNIDVFESGIIDTLEELLNKLCGGSNE